MGKIDKNAIVREWYREGMAPKSRETMMGHEIMRQLEYVSVKEMQDSLDIFPKTHSAYGLESAIKTIFEESPRILGVIEGAEYFRNRDDRAEELNHWDLAAGIYKTHLFKDAKVSIDQLKDIENLPALLVGTVIQRGKELLEKYDGDAKRLMKDFKEFSSIHEMVFRAIESPFLSYLRYAQIYEVKQTLDQHADDFYMAIPENVFAPYNIKERRERRRRLEGLRKLVKSMTPASATPERFRRPDFIVPLNGLPRKRLLAL